MQFVKMSRVINLGVGSEIRSGCVRLVRRLLCSLTEEVEEEEEEDEDGGRERESGRYWYRKGRKSRWASKAFSLMSLYVEAKS